MHTYLLHIILRVFVGLLGLLVCAIRFCMGQFGCALGVDIHILAVQRCSTNYPCTTAVFKQGSGKRCSRRP